MIKLDSYNKQDMVSPGISACQGCAGELVIRKVLKTAGNDTIVAVPPGCMAGSGVVGWNFNSGMKIPVHITLLDNTASFLTGITQMYSRKGRKETNIVAIAGDGASADCGFQSLSGAAERGEKMLYVCYDNEGYMNTGYQRSSTTTEGSDTSTTPLGEIISGKNQGQKYLPLIMSMHEIEYCATATPGYPDDFEAKIKKGLEASKRGFAYIHVFTPCPTGWKFPMDKTIEISKLAVKTNFFPLWEMDNTGYKLNYDNKKSLPVESLTEKIGKFKNLSQEQIQNIQNSVLKRYSVIKSLTTNQFDGGQDVY